MSMEITVGAITVACVIWARIHHHITDRRHLAGQKQGEPCEDE